jgi:hypothetical protein
MGTQSEGYNIEGIPLPGDLPQVDGSAAPNEPRNSTLSNPEGQVEEPYAVDYFDAEIERLGDNGPVVASKDNQNWSEGIEDEENVGEASFAELDDDWDEGVFPETQPLTVQGTATEQDNEELSSYMELQPDNLQHGPE